MAESTLARPDGTAADWTIPQRWSDYSLEDHATWDTLFARQAALLPGRVTPEFLDGMNILRLSKPGIPNFSELSDRLMAATGWQVVAVPGLVPDDVFFDHLANRRFVSGNFIRRPDQLDYLQEPDVFHDVFGHVPLLANPVFADYMQAYGRGGQRAVAMGAIDRLSRLYWYTVEFGLVRSGDDLKLYGAGIVSSYTESIFALDDPSPNRLGFDLKRLMRTKYRIDDFQQNYFVIDSFEDLLEQTLHTDFGPLYAELGGQDDIEIETILPTDTVFTRGSQTYAREGNCMTETQTRRAALFGSLERQPPDALLAVIGMHRADPRVDKIDVGVGVYRDAYGATPVMRAIKKSEAYLLAEQDTKGYLGAEGDQRFTDLLARIALGDALASDPRITGIQTPGGTGALRLAAELIARSHAAPTIWIGTPTWPNHAPIFREAGLDVRTHAYFDASRADIDFEAFVGGLHDARAGDVVLLHGCCHNPTGTAFSIHEWTALTKLVLERGFVPLIDLAYQGLGRSLDADAAGARAMVAAVPEALLSYSCDKNFALYRERVGALWVEAATPAGAIPVRETMLVLARSLWSMPPDHGAAAVRLILQDEALSIDWRSELSDMCARINVLRASLGAAHPVLAPLSRQQGLFALLPIDRTVVATLRSDHAIYMPDSGRINIAGLSEATLPRFVDALTPHLKG